MLEETSWLNLLLSSQVYEAEAVAVRRQKEVEADAALQQERFTARYAAETREIERAAVSQRAALEAKYRDAAAAAEAAMAQAEEYRQMLQSAGAEQNRAQVKPCPPLRVSLLR